MDWYQPLTGPRHHPSLVNHDRNLLDITTEYEESDDEDWESNNELRAWLRRRDQVTSSSYSHIRAASARATSRNATDFLNVDHVLDDAAFDMYEARPQGRVDVVEVKDPSRHLPTRKESTSIDPPIYTQQLQVNPSFPLSLQARSPWHIDLSHHNRSHERLPKPLPAMSVPAWLHPTGTGTSSAASPTYEDYHDRAPHSLSTTLSQAPPSYYILSSFPTRSSNPQATGTLEEIDRADEVYGNTHSNVSSGPRLKRNLKSMAFNSGHRGRLGCTDKGPEKTDLGDCGDDHGLGGPSRALLEPSSGFDPEKSEADGVYRVHGSPGGASLPGFYDMAVDARRLQSQPSSGNGSYQLHGSPSRGFKSIPSLTSISDSLRHRGRSSRHLPTPVRRRVESQSSDRVDDDTGSTVPMGGPSRSSSPLRVEPVNDVFSFDDSEDLSCSWGALSTDIEDGAERTWAVVSQESEGSQMADGSRRPSRSPSPFDADTDFGRASLPLNRVRIIPPIFGPRFFSELAHLKIDRISTRQGSLTSFF